MGGLAAILRFDNGCVDAERASRLLQKAQPVARGAFVVLFDGRLDNRRELRARLGVTDDCSDAQLVAAAIDAWDVSAPEHLLGDFAFVAWDAAHRRALLARDHFGLRTLYFHHTPQFVVCASDIAQVLEDPHVPVRPDDEVALRFLAGEPENGRSTLYRDVVRVPPACIVTVSAEGASFRTYWTAEPTRTIRYRNDAEYVDHCRDLLRESVDCRMEPDNPVATSLSGGLDSSAVTAVASLLVAGKPRPQPFSLVYPDEPQADERHYIELVSERLGVSPVLVLPARVTLDMLAGWARDWRDLPPMIGDLMTVPLWDEMSRRGFRVNLTGAGGDFVFSGSVFGYADMIRRGAFIAMARQWDATRRATYGEHGWDRLLTTGLWPALPVAAKRLLRPFARRLWNTHLAPTRRPWLKRQLPPLDYPDHPRGGSFAVEEIVRGLTSGLHSYFLESAGRVAMSRGIELRHPLLDVRLVEFMLAVPEDQRRRGPIRKYLLRRALERELPAAVHARRSKADFSHVVMDAFESDGERFFAALATGRRGWVDEEKLRQVFRRMKAERRAGAPHYGDDVPHLVSAAAVELWLRALGENGAV